MIGTRTGRRGCKVAALLVGGMSCVLPAVAATQSPHTITVRADNDAFNFWREPGARPDRDYTSGAFLRYDGGDAPWWARAFTRSHGSCRAQESACRTKALEIGHHIYTPERNRANPEPPPGSRPNAGWLFIREAVRVLRDTRSDEFGVALGVTGKPALAHEMQELFHALSPSYNRPTDWSEQLDFETGVTVSYLHERRVLLGSAGAIGFDLLPRAGVEAGNVLTTAELGLRMRAGFRLRHPWLRPRSDAPVEVSLAGGGAARGVARDLFLDGRTDGDGEGPGHEPFVHELDWLVRVQYRWLMLSYGAVTKSRTYATGYPSHTWSSLTLGLTLVR